MDFAEKVYIFSVVDFPKNILSKPLSKRRRKSANNAEIFPETA